MKKILIIGRGTLGSAFEGLEWLGDTSLHYASRNEAKGYKLDIGQDIEVEAFFRNHSDYDLVVNCAAMSAVDECERNPEKAFEANALGVKNLASSCHRYGIPYVHVSTDYVFSGQNDKPYSEDDIASPRSIYGVTKLIGEYYALHGADYVAVIRPSWIFGEYQDKFVSHFSEKLRKGDSVKVIDDQVSCATYARDMAEGIGRIVMDKLLPAKKRGEKYRQIFHMTNEGSVTRHEMVLYMRDILNRNSEVRAIQSKELTQWVALRPRYSVLSKDKYKKTFAKELRTWQEALGEHLRA